MPRHLVIQLRPQQPPRLGCPASRDVGHLVPAAAQDKSLPSIPGHASNGRGVTPGGQVELAQPIPGQGIGPALQYDGPGVEASDGSIHHGGEDGLVAFVVDSVPQRGILRKALSRADADVVQRSGSREEAVSVFVEGNSEDSVGGEEGLLDAVAVVDVDVDVEDAVFVVVVVV